jgi:ribosomal protein S18 acetylase RimI-like enzyme
MSGDTTIKIRPMVESDLAAVSDVDMSISGKGRVSTWPFSFETYWGLHKQDALVLVAELNGVVSGFLSGHIERPPRSNSIIEQLQKPWYERSDDPVGWIEMMGIRPESWHKGIGTRLLEAFRAECNKKKAKIRIVARQDDQDLVAFLERAGFQKGEMVTYELPA